MATPKEISEEQFKELWYKLLNKATKLRAKHGSKNTCFWFSAAFDPCGMVQPRRSWKGRTPDKIDHFTKIPCDEYCKESLPVATCIVTILQSGERKYYICHHRVGNCPWKV